MPLNQAIGKAFQYPGAEKAGLFQEGKEVFLGERAGDALPPQGVVVFDGRVRLIGGDHVGHHQAAAGFEDPQGLPEGAALVAGEVDDTVGQDDIQTGVREGQVLQVAQLEVQIIIPQVGGHPHRAPGGPAQHGGEHVHPGDPACRPHQTRGYEAFHAGAAPQVQNGLTGLEPCIQDRAAAAVAAPAGLLRVACRVQDVFLGGLGRVLVELSHRRPAIRGGGGEQTVAVDGGHRAPGAAGLQHLPHGQPQAGEVTVRFPGGLLGYEPQGQLFI